MNQFLQAPNSNFAAVRDGRASMPLYVDIDLGTQRRIGDSTALILNIAANSLYIDADTATVGFGVIHFQDVTLGQTSAPMFVSPGFIANVPFTQLMIENEVQVGKRLRIFYGVDIDFQAGVNTSLKISGVVDVRDSGVNDSLTGKALRATLSQTGVAGKWSSIQVAYQSGSAATFDFAIDRIQIQNDYTSGAVKYAVIADGETTTAPLPEGSTPFRTLYQNANAIATIPQLRLFNTGLLADPIVAAGHGNTFALGQAGIGEVTDIAFEKPFIMRASEHNAGNRAYNGLRVFCRLSGAYHLTVCVHGTVL